MLSGLVDYKMEAAICFPRLEEKVVFPWSSELFLHGVLVLVFFSALQRDKKKSLEEGVSSKLFFHGVLVLFSALQPPYRQP
jgi:hypothetical protein